MPALIGGRLIASLLMLIAPLLMLTVIDGRLLRRRRNVHAAHHDRQCGDRC
jgi:hypothetical protein